jgi:DNA helicase-2/ATP-dependent DNA helicase PcrA
MFGSYETQYPSRFFKDVPDQLVQMESPVRSATQRGYDRWERGSYRRDAARNRFKQEDSYFESWDEKKTAHTWDSVNANREKRLDGAQQGYAAILPQKSDGPQREKKKEATYRPGMKVRHPSFGEGLVINVRLEGDGEETLDIFFADSKQQKKLAASFIKLDILE